MKKSNKGLSASLLAGSEDYFTASRKSSTSMKKSNEGLSASLLAGSEDYFTASRKSSTSMKKSDKGLSASLLAGSEDYFTASRKSSTSMKKSDTGLSASLLAGSEDYFTASRKSSTSMKKSDTGLSASLLAGSEDYFTASRKSSTSMKQSGKGLSASLLAGSEELIASRKSSKSMKRSDTGLSASLLVGSEEIFEFFCQPCSTDNLHIDAAGFCTVCKEYLCDTCFKCHRKNAASKHHKLLGKDDMPKSTIVSKSPEKQQNVKEEAKFSGEVRVKTDDDTMDCLINGIAALPGGRIVVTDISNNAIKLVDTMRNKVTCRLPLSSRPLDVVAMAPNKVVASLGIEKKLEIFTVTDTLSRNSTINVASGVPFCKVCFDGDKFILVSVSDRVMMMVDLSGSVLSKVSLRTFTSPLYIAIGRDRSVVYITDDEARTVTTISLSGRIISVYKNDKLKYPLGVTVGCDNSVYVCSCHTDTVHQMTATGQLVRIILDTQRGLAPYPLAIAYDDEQDRLYISSNSVKPEYRDYVRSFKLEQ